VATSKSTDVRSRVWTWVRFAGGIAIVVAIFLAVIPRIASYARVWETVSLLSAAEVAMVLGAACLNLITYWLQTVAALPGISVAQAAVVIQTGTTIANTVPAGGAASVAITYAILRSWGRSQDDIVLLTLVTGAWNSFVKLGLPVVALALLAATGAATAQIAALAGIGVALLVAAIALFALGLWKESVAERVGTFLGRLLSLLRRAIGKPRVRDVGRRAVDFRRRTVELLRRRWTLLTLATVASHASLFVVLLVSLRALGVSSDEVTWIEALGVFAFARLVTALPVTPGGVGVVELSYIGGLVVAGGERPAVVASVLLFRGVTYFLQIPIGAVTYPIWQRRESWKRPRRPSAERARTRVREVATS
jgi:putative heme transporter